MCGGSAVEADPHFLLLVASAVGLCSAHGASVKGCGDPSVGSSAAVVPVPGSLSCRAVLVNRMET